MTKCVYTVFFVAAKDAFPSVAGSSFEANVSIQARICTIISANNSKMDFIEGCRLWTRTTHSAGHFPVQYN